MSGFFAAVELHLDAANGQIEEINKMMEAMYRKLKDKGLVVLGFPCDQFGHQEPGTLPVAHVPAQLEARAEGDQARDGEAHAQAAELRMKGAR